LIQLRLRLFLLAAGGIFDGQAPGYFN